VSSDDITIQLAAKSPRRLLDDLAKLAKTHGSRPEVELVLSAGTIVRGRVASLGDDGGGPIVLVQTGGEPRAPSVAYVRVDAVVAITVVDASVLVRPASSETPAPSKLELARALGARADSMTTALGRALPMTASPDLDDDGRRAVAALLPPLVDTLRAIAREGTRKHGLDALAGIELGAGQRAEIRRNGDKLVIITSRADSPAPDRLRAEIEALL
jgi:hypothetical protein